MGVFKKAEHKEETRRLNKIINKAYRWIPDFADMLNIENICQSIGHTLSDFTTLRSVKAILFSGEHSRWFSAHNIPIKIVRDISVPLKSGRVNN